MSTGHVALGDLIAPAPVRRAGDHVYPILSMTMREGLVDQAQKFKKRVASEDLSAYRVVRKGQLVVGFPIDEGVLAFQNAYPEAIVSPAYGIWDVVPGADVHLPYLGRFLKSPRALTHYRAKLRGSTARRRSLSRDVFLELRVPLPPIEEQRQIAAVLDAADALRAKRQKVLTRLDTLSHAIFIDMFGDPRLGTHDQVRLADHVEVVTKGTTPTSVGMGFADEGIHFVRATDLIAGTVDATKVELRISASTNASLARSQLKPGDVLVSIAGTIGRVAVVPDNAPEMNCNQAVALIRAKPSLLSDYLAAWLNTRHAQDQMMGSKVTGTISNLSLSSIKKLELPLPDPEAQMKFVERIQSVACHKSRVAAAHVRLDDFFASLQQRMFRGEL